MLIAVISDVHSNLEAFEAVLKDMKAFNPDTKVNLGDLVGYGPNPKEVIALNIENGFITIKGNHDAAIEDDSILERFSPAAGEAILLHRNLLRDSEKEYLRKLPLNYSANGLFFVHGFPPNSFIRYACTETDCLDFDHTAFDNFRERICFLGHTHYVMLFSQVIEKGTQYFGVQQKEIITHRIGMKIPKIETLENGIRYVVNVGSVGQPRDGSPEAKYFIFDTEKNSLEFIKVKYNFEKTMEKMESMNLSEGTRLKYGR